ncbi:hypothetical protein PAESOLCIP111_00003 [Paenibacillus solanacearum]|uniref:Uncharacterized protein n=1 Tax=Paenibacillus solanacearum TaxID=2048548 RepID=A0A916NJY3_9BACL|nr:hypothetical protein [Paenibacillus solanacearum]CAG7594629.1 hypothetical protein PAESOLCIP111_00003 [Paenibacillus solanacearum]
MKVINDLYIKTNSYDLWWGIHGIAELTGWEDITFYNSLEGNSNRIGYTCICTKNYMSSVLEDLEEDPDQRDFVKHIKEYLKDNVIHYHYCFDNPSNDDFFELAYNNLPVNGLGLKPSYIEMWHPNVGIDKQVIEECIKEFCYKFLNTRFNRIHYINPISLDEAIISYNEHLQRMGVAIEFSDNLIRDMMKKLSKSKEEISKMLNKSIEK